MANVLGINLSDLPAAAAKEKAAEFLNSPTQHYIVTPNPEIILKSHQDEELFYILNKADLSIADGFGLKVAGWLAGLSIPRLAGADLTLYLLSLAEKEGTKAVVLNWRGGLSTKTDIRKALNQKYPGLDCLVIDASRSQPLDPKIISRLNDFAPSLLFNTFGSPYQEKVIYHNLKKLPSVRLALGVGGAFDFITTKARRAPKAFRKAGLEWLWRLIKQPKRWKRIYNATAVFMAKLCKARLNHFFYRPCVACFLYKNEGGRHKILIVEREDEPGHWQIPQGGTDGESLETAGARELREELNTDKFTVKATFRDTYSYLFPPVSDQRSMGLSRRFKYDYKGQRQGLCIAEFIGDDQGIKVNFWDHRAWRWIDESDFVSSISPFRQESAKIFLEKFRSLRV
jgi:N-acetylglucosaminyldiphosphoundecaprenol N-acetyl-beta-D-mannosaminyltransferase